MEKDTTIVAGASDFTLERLMHAADPFQVCICRNCKIVTSTLKECQSCNGNSISVVNIPFGSKLLFTELGAMGIKTLITPNET